MAPVRHVATLVSNPRWAALTNAVLARVTLIPGAQTTRWLDPGIAADVAFVTDDTPRMVTTTIREALSGAPIDIIVQPIGTRRKRLLVADMDSTMIGQECIDELADFAGIKPRVAAITERAMRGEIAFEPALRERVALLKGLPQDIVAQVICERITLTPGGRTLVATMRHNGAYAALVSGGFTLFTSMIATMIGFDEHRANVLALDRGRLAGFVEEPVLGGQAKLAVLRELRETFGLSADETLAVGDGANDLAMLAEAGLGVAFRAKPTVAEAADARIDHADLTALLYAQGYRSADFLG